MATGKKAPGGTRNTNTKRRRSPRKKKGGGSPLMPPALISVAGFVLSRGFAGVFLLVLGLFLTASFLTGRGEFLGEAGLVALTTLAGVLGYVLAPLAALAGVLLLLDRIPWVRAAGAALLLLAVATTLAAGLPQESLFDAQSYRARGGLLGSALYGAVHSAGGAVGAAFALAALYAAGALILTGLPPRRLAEWVAASYRTLTSRLAARRTRRRTRRDEDARRTQRDRERTPRVRRRNEEEEDIVVNMRATAAPPEEPLPGEVFAGEEEEVFEVVLPESSGRDLSGLEGERTGPVEPGEYEMPAFSLLNLGRGDVEHDATGTSRRLTRALSELGVEAHVVRAVVGPRVTRYELRLGSGVKVSKVSSLQQDIAYALAATEVRILAPIPGKSAVGVEVPNTKPAMVTLGDVFREYPDANEWSLPVGVGKDISGRAVFFDLAEMPHLLVAGTTGSGKSVMLNGLLTSLLLTTDPRRVKMVLIDPKRVELSQFARVPHLITPVVTDVKKAANALTWAVAEMERRYEVLEEEGVRSLDGYNARAERPLPYVVVVIDELADLMMTAAQKVEDAIIRLAQKARAVGIHLVVATQRPSVDVITGMIKANVPSRIAFAVSSQVDSRVILDTPGAEALLGQGDMLFKPVSALRPSRVQGAYISEDEVERVVSASASAMKARYVEEVTQARGKEEESAEPEDDLLPEAASFVVASQQASVSAVQRRFRVGYSRAGRIIDALERKGVVGPYEGSKSRSVVATELDLAHVFGEAPPDAVGAPRVEDASPLDADARDRRGTATTGEGT